MQKGDTFKTSSGIFLYQENGILSFMPDKSVRMEKRHNLENFAAVKENMIGIKTPLLTDLRGTLRPTKDSIRFTNEVDLGDIHIAAAAIVGSGVSSLIGNFLLKVNKFSIPTKLFTSKKAAEEWLSQFIENQ